MDRHWRTRSRLAGLALAFGLWALVVPTAAAGPREQAKRMHDRLVGVPPSDAVLASMEASISGGDPLGAANTAMADPIFYKSALKNWVTPWTNVPRQRVRRPERLHRDRDRHGARRRARSTRCSPRTWSTRARRAWCRPATRRPTTSTTSSSSSRTSTSPIPNLFVGAPAVDAAGLGAERERDRRRDHDPRRERRVFLGRHQPPHVALHRDQLPVPRHGAAERHHAARGPHPPGRVAQPRRRQPHLPQHLRRLSQRHGRARGRVRLLPVGRHGHGAPRSRAEPFSRSS